MEVKKYLENDLKNYLLYTSGIATNKNIESTVKKTLRKISFFNKVYDMKSNLSKCLFDETYQPRYLFHGTTTDKLSQILQEGLDPSKSFLGPIYLVVDFDNAESWARSKSIRTNSKPTVVYIDRNKLSNLTFERRDESTIRCNELIPSTNIKPVGRILKYFLTH
ncbi:MAG: hypothetical protein WC812_01675 [Candidatus Pacearchaeota archaeon]|jgi:hypothetical protein